MDLLKNFDRVNNVLGCSWRIEAKFDVFQVTDATKVYYKNVI